MDELIEYFYIDKYRLDSYVSQIKESITDRQMVLGGKIGFDGFLPTGELNVQQVIRDKTNHEKIKMLHAYLEKNNKLNKISFIDILNKSEERFGSFYDYIESSSAFGENVFKATKIIFPKNLTTEFFGSDYQIYFWLSEHRRKDGSLNLITYLLPNYYEDCEEPRVYSSHSAFRFLLQKLKRDPNEYSYVSSDEENKLLNFYHEIGAFVSETRYIKSLYQIRELELMHRTFIVYPIYVAKASKKEFNL